MCRYNDGFHTAESQGLAGFDDIHTSSAVAGQMNEDVNMYPHHSKSRAREGLLVEIVWISPQGPSVLVQQGSGLKELNNSLTRGSTCGRITGVHT